MSELNERYAPAIEIHFRKRNLTEDEISRIESALRDRLMHMVERGAKIPSDKEGESIIQRAFEEVMGYSFIDAMNGFSLTIKEPKS